MDRYPMLVQTKGGQAVFLAKTLVITSNTTPPTWYSKIAATTAGLKAFYRRVTKFIYMGANVSIASKSFQEFDLSLERHSTLLG